MNYFIEILTVTASNNICYVFSVPVTSNNQSASIIECVAAFGYKYELENCSFEFSTRLKIYFKSDMGDNLYLLLQIDTPGNDLDSSD